VSKLSAKVFSKVN